MGKSSTEKNSKGKKKWIRPRHKFFWKYVVSLSFPFIRRLYGVRVETFAEKGERQYLILMNHQTICDPLFAAMAFHRPIYFLANENLFSNGLTSCLLRFLVAPIPIMKQTTDIRAVRTLIRVAKEGGMVLLFPEGNRTYSGETGYINPSVSKLIKAVRLPVVLLRIEGGYGVQPRWSDAVRRGRARVFASHVIEPKELEALSNEELYAMIQRDLYVNETDTGGTYTHRRLAEYLERVVYVCPDCGLSEFESHNDTVWCKKCQKKVRYLPSKELRGVGFPFAFRTVTEWYHSQCRYINRLDTGEYLRRSLYEDCVMLLEVIPCKRKRVLLRRVRAVLYGDRIELRAGNGAEITFRFTEVSAITILEANRLNIYQDSRLYQVKGAKRFNALKYLNIYYRHKNICSGKESGFLGL